VLVNTFNILKNDEEYCRDVLYALRYDYEMMLKYVFMICFDEH
jgi:hypothetical protein